MDNTQLTQLAKQPPILIKFAGLLPDGRLASDAFDAYQGLFEGLPPGWTATESKVQPRGQNWDHDAWIFSHPEADGELAAVAHETGLEFLAMGLAAPLLVELIKWTLGRWNQRRKGKGKVESSVVVEVVRETDGSNVRTTVRYVAPPPVSGDEVAALIARIQRELGTPL